MAVQHPVAKVSGLSRSVVLQPFRPTSEDGDGDLLKRGLGEEIDDQIGSRRDGHGSYRAAVPGQTALVSLPSETLTLHLQRSILRSWSTEVVGEG